MLGVRSDGGDAGNCPVPIGQGEILANTCQVWINDEEHKLPEVIQTKGGFLVVHPALAIYRAHIWLDLLQLFHL